jgi:proline iminopeptidase
MEQLRGHLGIERWLVFGGSWGSTLSIAYAERHPERVSELVLVAFWLMGRKDVDWLYRGGVARLFPQEWERFAYGVQDPVAAYVERLDDPDAEVRRQAALDWTTWEDAVLSLEPNGKPAPYSDRASDASIAFARICAHYAAHDGWLADGDLLENAGRLRGIQGVILHGRQDLSCPLDSAWAFAQAWPEGELTVFDDAGHKGSPAMSERLRGVLERFGEL